MTWDISLRVYPFFGLYSFPPDQSALQYSSRAKQSLYWFENGCSTVSKPVDYEGIIRFYHILNKTRELLPCESERLAEVIKKQAWSDAQRRYRVKNRQRLNEKRREYWASNPEKRNENARKWRAANPERSRETSRAWRVRSKGMSNGVDDQGEMPGT